LDWKREQRLLLKRFCNLSWYSEDLRRGRYRNSLIKKTFKGKSEHIIERKDYFKILRLIYANLKDLRVTYTNYYGLERVISL
jgi:hypothetical protein